MRMIETNDRTASPDPVESKPRVTKLRGIRKIWTSLHRWIGIVAGVYLVIAGLTGSILAFWQDIDEWLNRDIMRVSISDRNAVSRPLDEIVAAAKAAMPPAAMKPNVPIAIKLPRHDADTVHFNYILGLPDVETIKEVQRSKDESKIDLSQMEGHELFVDPYSGTVTGERKVFKGLNPFSTPFIQIVNSLHYALWIPLIGGLVVALLGLLLFISILDGIALWWPVRGKWRNALTLKANPSAERFVFDLHKILGAYFGVVLVVSVFSGMYMSFKPPWRALVSLMSPLHEMPKQLHSQASESHRPLSVEAAVAVADAAFPDGRLQFVNMPLGPDGFYRIGKRIDDEVNQAGTHRTVTIDQYTGAVLHKEDPRDYSVGDKFFEWQYPLHSGEAFGNYGRAFMLVFGLVPAGLYITGFIRWRHKRRAHKATKRRTEKR